MFASLPRRKRRLRAGGKILFSERHKESPGKRAKRIAKYEDERKRNHVLMEQMVKAFDFTVMGETRMNGHDVYVLKATPRPGYHRPIWRRKL
jgi:hypothetical protein